MLRARCFRVSEVIFSRNSLINIRERFRGSAGETIMADYNPLALLSALLFFTALTARDIYLGRSSPERGQVTTPSLYRDAEPSAHSAKARPGLYSGPVLKFQYW